MSLCERGKHPPTSQHGFLPVVRGQLAFQAQTVDFSKGGACIKRPRNWSSHIGDEVLVFPLGDPGQVICFKAQVRWFQDDEIGFSYL